MAAQNEPMTGKRKAVMIALSAGALLVAGFLYFRSSGESEVQGVARKTFDLMVAWRCLDCGHTIQDNVAAGSKACPKCNKNSMYPSLGWNCTAHGRFEFAFQYNNDGDPSQFKYADGPWKPAFNPSGGWNLECPKCGGGMFPG